MGQIVTATWRLRRARTAESGEIALSVDGVSWQRENHNPLPLMLAMPPNPVSEELVTKLQRSVLGCHYLLHCLRDLRTAVAQQGDLTEVMVSDFKKWMRDQAGDMCRKLEQFLARRVANPEQLEPEALRARHKEEVL